MIDVKLKEKPIAVKNVDITISKEYIQARTYSDISKSLNEIQWRKLMEYDACTYALIHYGVSKSHMHKLCINLLSPFSPKV